MPTYLYHETLTCEVTFVRRITADDAKDAKNMAHDGDGELLGVTIGDSTAGVAHSQMLPDAPHNIPANMYPEASRT